MGARRTKSLYPKLPPGRTQRSAEETARIHRARLMGAMIEAVARHGYLETTLRELVALAGVSNTTFYEQFGSLQECFLATFDEVVGQGVEEILAAYGSASGLREGLHAAIEKYVDLAIEHPPAAHLVLVDSLNLGAAGVAQRQRATDTYQLLFRRSIDQAPEAGEISDLLVRAIVGGFHRVVYRRVRSGRSEQLRNEIETLLDWGLSYRREGGASGWHLPAAGPMMPTARAPRHPELKYGEIWADPSAGGSSTPTQRERMIGAAAMVVAKGGYEKLTIPAITSAARVSNQTFYEYFSSAQAPFLEALDALDRLALSRIDAAIKSRWTWPEALVAGLDELLTVYSESPALSRLPMIEALCAGSVGLDRIDRMQDHLIAAFNLDKVPAEVGNPPPQVIGEALAGGIDAVIQYEVAQGKAKQLPELLGELTFFALAPLELDWRGKTDSARNDSEAEGS